MFCKKSLFVVFTVFVFCQSSFVDNLTKCHINDGDCQREMMQTMIRDIAKTGVPELGIPKLDPMKMENISMSILDVLDITLHEGNLRGIKDCIVDKFVTKIEKGHASIELTCDTSIKGHYEVFSASPLIKTFFGGDTIHGDGIGKVKVEKLHLKFDYFFIIQRRNGELYFKCKPDKTVYKFSINGKMTFVADSLYIGNKESSKVVTGLLNENWPFLMSTFGKPFMDKAMGYVNAFLHSYFHNVAIKHFIIDDLSSYARDE